MGRLALSAIACGLLSLCGGPAPLAVGAEQAKTSLTVAVLSFHARLPGQPELGVQMGDMLMAVLSSNDQFRLVDRESLNQVLSEQQLSLTGLVSNDQTIKVGKLVGAKLMVSGRAFRIGDKTVITAKILGTETSLVEVLMVKGTRKEAIDELVLALGQKIEERITKSGKKLLGKDLKKPDPLPPLITKLKKSGKKPVVAIIVTEEHIAGPRPLRQAIDPAVETELKVIFGKAGFQVKDLAENELAEWAKDYVKKGKGAWPQGLEDVDYIVTGEAFSQFATRIGALVSCTARAEINIIRRADGRIVLAERATTRAIDLAEHISGKTALQKAGHELGIRALQHFATAREK